MKKARYTETREEDEEKDKEDDVGEANGRREGDILCEGI